jgi:hypothetical protein
MLDIFIAYVVIGIILGSFKYKKAFKYSEFRGNTLKIEAIGCVFFWPVALWLEKCFGEPEQKKRYKNKK